MPPHTESAWTATSLTKLAAALGALALLVSNLSTRAALLPYTPPPNSNNACKAYHPEILHSCEDFRLFAHRGSEYVLASCNKHRRDRPPLGFSENPTSTTQLYLWDLHNPASQPEDITSRFPDKFHTLGLSIKKVGENKLRLFTVNRKIPTSSMDVWDIDLASSSSANKVASIHHELVYHPNSVTSIDENSFVFTNDHRFGKDLVLEITLGLPLADVVHVTFSDGKDPVLRSLVKVSSPNGVEIDSQRKKLYVASMAYGLYVYDYSGDGESLSLGSHKLYQTPFIPDNLQISTNGDVCFAGHPHSKAIGAAMLSADAPDAPSWAARLLRPDENTTTVDDISKHRLWNRKDHVWKTLFLDDGSLLGSSTTAVTFDGGKKAAITGLFGKGIVVCNNY